MREPVWIGERDALALHARLLAVHDGAPGVAADPEDKLVGISLYRSVCLDLPSPCGC